MAPAASRPRFSLPLRPIGPSAPADPALGIPRPRAPGYHTPTAPLRAPRLRWQPALPMPRWTPWGEINTDAILAALPHIERLTRTEPGTEPARRGPLSPIDGYRVSQLALELLTARERASLWRVWLHPDPAALSADLPPIYWPPAFYGRGVRRCLRRSYQRATGRLTAAWIVQERDGATRMLMESEVVAPVRAVH